MNIDLWVSVALHVLIVKVNMSMTRVKANLTAMLKWTISKTAMSHAMTTIDSYLCISLPTTKKKTF